MKVELFCDFCGKAIYRNPSQIKKHNFCSRQCLADYSSKTKNPDGYQSLKDLSGVSLHMSALNRELNPNRMTEQVRSKLRNQRLGTGKGKTYTKLYGVHEHRVVAEKMLGRKLKPGEIVHHMDFNKRNNDPKNLMIFPSSSHHAAYHAKLRRFLFDGIIDSKCIEEVMPL